MSQTLHCAHTPNVTNTSLRTHQMSNTSLRTHQMSQTLHCAHTKCHKHFTAHTHQIHPRHPKTLIHTLVLTLWQGFFFGLMFCGPCIAIYLCNKNQQDALFYTQFTSIINLYMFLAGLLLIIRRHFPVYTAIGMSHAFMLTGCRQDQNGSNLSWHFPGRTE